ncbi:winged helix-turn-helix transcriptional regulator [Kitasatospora sp. NPDC001159]
MTSDTPHARTLAAAPGRPCSMAAAPQVVARSGRCWRCASCSTATTASTGSPRALEEAGVVERRAYSERPLRYEYHLTEAGRDFALAHALRTWGDRWLVPDSLVTFAHGPEGREPHPSYPAWVCRTCGREARRGEPHAEVHTPGLDGRGPCGAVTGRAARLGSGHARSRRPQ